MMCGVNSAFAWLWAYKLRRERLRAKRRPGRYWRRYCLNLGHGDGAEHRHRQHGGPGRRVWAFPCLTSYVRAYSSAWRRILYLAKLQCRSSGCLKLVTAVATAAWRSATLAWDKALREAELIEETIVTVNKVSSSRWMQDCKQYYQYFSQLYIRQFSHQPYGVGSPPGTTIGRKKQTTRKAKKPASLLREILGASSRPVKIGKDLSINDAAAKANIDWSYFAQIERGERSVGLDVMDALAQADGVLLFELLDPSFQKLNELEQ